MIVVFSSSENASKNGIEMDEPLGFKAKIEFKTGKNEKNLLFNINIMLLL